MRKIWTSLIAAAAVSAATLPAVAQIGVRASTSAQRGSEEIVVTGDKRKPNLAEELEQVIAPTDSQQLARFEKPVCPAVRGLPSDWAARVERMIRDNVVAVGGRAAPADCSVNALVVLVDDPHALVVRLNAQDPTFFDMTPRAFDNFARPNMPAYSWKIANTYGPRGQILRQLSTLTYVHPDTGVIMTSHLQPGTTTSSDGTGSRLTTGAREEIEVGFVAIDRDLSEGKSLRQIADFATLHLLLDIKEDAGRRNGGSILALFEQRPGWVPPMRMGNFDRGMLSGFYNQKHNNRSAIQQRENIAAAMRKDAKAEETER